MAFVAAAAGAAITWIGGAAASAGALLTSSLSVAGLSTFTASAITSAVGTLTLNAGLAALSTVLMQPQVGAGGSPVAFKADPAAPIAGVMGRFGVAGRQVHANTWGKDNLYLSFAVALSLGPIQSVAAFSANDTPVTFPGAQGLAANVEPYKDKMWQTYALGLPTDAALLPPTGVDDGSPSMSEWTSSHKLPGFAQAFWTLKNNSKRASYEGGVPSPLWTLHGMKLWNPALDSTYPGGVGSQRRDDWRTWGYTEDPYLHALAFTRGHFKLNTDGTIDRTKRLAGIGAPDAAIDIAAFVEGSNVCTANGWKISGEWTTVDDKWQVLAAMLQAGGGVPLNRGAQISCMVEAPRISLLTLTGADIVGPVSMSVMASRRDRPNTIIPRCRLEAQKFEEVALGAVTSTTYRDEDGGEPRTREVSYAYVGQAKQAAELAAYGLANARETLKASIPCKPHLLGLRAGDAFTVNEPELGLNGQKFVVLKRGFDPGSATVTLEVRSETDAKHPWALGQVADPPETPSLTAADPIPAPPPVEDWGVILRPPEAGGGQQPGLVITASAVGDNVGAVTIEVGGASAGPWEQVYHGPPTTETVPVNGLDRGATYYVAITYWSLKGVPSEQTVFGPYTAPDLIASDTINVGGVAAATLLQAVEDTEQAIIDADARITAARASLTQQGERLLAEVARAKVGILAEQSVRITEMAIQITRIDGLLARMTDAETGITEAEALIATLESVTVDLENPTSLASQIEVLSSALDTVEGDLSAQITTINSTLTQHATDLDDLAGDIVILDAGLVAAQGDIADNETALVAVAGRTDALETEVDTLGDGVAGNAAGLLSVQQAVSTETAAGVYQAEHAYARSARGKVSVLAERLLRVTETAAVYTEIDAVELNLTGDIGDLSVLVSDNTTAILDLETGKASVTDVNLLAAAVDDVEADLLVQSGAIVDIEGQLQAAFFEVIAAAGGDPAHLAVKAGPTGSLIGLAATVLVLKNIVGDSVVEALKLIGGEAYFGAPISADISGRRLTIGPGFGASSGLVLWFGPNTTAIASMSRTNGYFALGTDGKVYYGSAELGAGTGADGAAMVRSTISGAVSTTSWTTIASVTLNNRPASGWWGFDGTAMSGYGTAAFQGDWQIIESGGASPLTSGTVELPAGPPAGLATVDGLFGGPFAQTLAAGAQTVLLQVRLNGPASTGTFSGTFAASYTPAV